MTRTQPTPRLTAYRRVVTDAPVSYSVYSAFSFYGPRHGGELPGRWLVDSLGALGHDVAAIRQTLYRMEGSAELESRVEGRSKFYRLTAAARAEAEAGLAKIMTTDETPWDREWTVVVFRSGNETRVERERLREVLRADGFATLAPGVYMHPHDRSRRILDAAAGHDASEMVEVFRGARIRDDDRAAFVAAHWNLPEIAARYRGFVRKYDSLALTKQQRDPEICFVLRFAVVFDYLEVAWSDPQLPSELLPAEWPGHRAQQLVRDLYRALLAPAIAFGDAVMNRSRSTSSPRAL